MRSATSEQTVWSLQGNLAELSCDSLSGHIEIARPHLGLHGIALLDASSDATNVLGVHRTFEKTTHAAAPKESAANAWPLPVAEAYTRGSDLVGCYEPVRDWPFSPQVYWRAGTLRGVPDVLASMSLLVSVQTHLLDTCPQIGVSSQLPFGETVLVAISDSGRGRVEQVEGNRTFSPENESFCVVRRPPNWPHSYVEIMEPSDFREVTMRSEVARSSTEWQLFADFLEKGVIRRARVHAAFLPRENDIELATVCCEAARQLDLPLTT